MSPGPLGLDDEAFFTDVRRREKEQLEELLASDFRGLLLDGPTLVALEERQALPLAGWFGLVTRELELANPHLRMLLMASSLDDGSVLVDLALHPGKEPARRRPAPPPRGIPMISPDASASLSMFDFDARARLPDLPWTPGTWCFRTLLRDRASNAVRVRLEGPSVPTTPAPPRSQPAPPWPPAGEAGPRYRDLDDAPPPPAKHGIVLAAERVLVPTEAGARWVVRAGWRLPVRARERVRPSPDGAAGPAWLGLYPDLAAVVPITLVITASGAPGPWVLPLRAPCFALAGDEGTGQLELDLLRLAGAPRGAGETYFIFAVAGDVFAGPAPTALVAEEALPFTRGGAP